MRWWALLENGTVMVKSALEPLSTWVPIGLWVLEFNLLFIYNDMFTKGCVSDNVVVRVRLAFAAITNFPNCSLAYHIKAYRWFTQIPCRWDGRNGDGTLFPEVALSQLIEVPPGALAQQGKSLQDLSHAGSSVLYPKSDLYHFSPHSVGQN